MLKKLLHIFVGVPNTRSMLWTQWLSVEKVFAVQRFTSTLLSTMPGILNKCTCIDSVIHNAVRNCIATCLKIMITINIFTTIVPVAVVWLKLNQKWHCFGRTSACFLGFFFLFIFFEIKSQRLWRNMYRYRAAKVMWCSKHIKMLPFCRLLHLEQYVATALVSVMYRKNAMEYLHRWIMTGF